MSDSVHFQFSAQATLISRIQKPPTKNTMHLDCASDHLTRKRLRFLSFVLIALFMVIHSFLEQRKGHSILQSKSGFTQPDTDNEARWNGMGSLLLPVKADDWGIN